MDSSRHRMGAPRAAFQRGGARQGGLARRTTRGTCGMGCDARRSDAGQCREYLQRSVGLGPTACCASRRLQHRRVDALPRQALPLRLSYSARPAFHSTWKNPGLDHCMNFRCTALAPPKRSLGSVFHCQPARMYTMASKTRRAPMGGRPAPAVRRYCLLGPRVGWSTKGSN